VSFTKKVENFARRAATNTALFVQGAASDALAAAHESTPVLTGQMRASWRIGVNEEDTSRESPRYVINTGDRSDETGTVDLPSFYSQVGKLGSVGAFDTIFISNSTGYARDVNTPGYSDKVDGGVVDPAVAKIENRLVNPLIRYGIKP